MYLGIICYHVPSVMGEHNPDSPKAGGKPPRGLEPLLLAVPEDQPSADSS